MLLPLPLAPEQADAVVGVEPQVQALQHRLAWHVAGRGSLQPDQRARQGFGRIGNRKGATRSSICSAIGCMRASALTRLCACVAFEALALKRVMNASMWRRSSSCFFLSLRSRRCFSRRVSSNWS